MENNKYNFYNNFTTLQALRVLQSCCKVNNKIQRFAGTYVRKGPAEDVKQQIQHLQGDITLRVG